MQAVLPYFNSYISKEYGHEEMKISILEDLIERLEITPAATEAINLALSSLGVVVAAILATVIVRKTLLRFLTSWIQNNQYRWDDPLAANNLLTKISWFVPVAIVTLAVDSLLTPGTSIFLLAKRFTAAAFVIVAILSCTALLSTINDIHRIVRKNKGSSLRGYTDAGKILTYVLGGIFIVSIFTGKSPWGILSILGGLTAVTMLVFKDSILGFVASIQLTSTDMVRLGDWIEMEKYGADGDVIEMSIHSIKVQNWDKTITTIPTYALVSNSFKNWRGMSESGGRRIKRSLSIDVQSIRFCDEEMVEKFSAIPLLTDYIKEKELEIFQFNKKKEIDPTNLLGGRRQTNIGVFRAYIIAYLKSNPNLHHNDMTFLVRQLAPTSQGLPLEIYVFSKDKAWSNYEAIQADIFDHLFAAVTEFGLRVYQYPSGRDFFLPPQQ